MSKDNLAGTAPEDWLIAGVGVRPSTALAEAAGLAMDRGILVDSSLRTNDPAIYAAGDAARYPDRHSQELLRIEHWAVAQNQGRIAARNMLGLRETFRHVPFFWSQHYDVTIGYVGHAETWDALEIDGDPAALDCVVKFVRGGSVMAVATSLAAHADMMRGYAGVTYQSVDYRGAHFMNSPSAVAHPVRVVAAELYALRLAPDGSPLETPQLISALVKGFQLAHSVCIGTAIMN